MSVIFAIISGEVVVKVGVLGWDYGEEDPDSPGLAETGRELGHDVTLFTLEEVAYASRGGRLEVLFAGEPATSFDAVISRANLYGEWKQNLYDGWPDRVERLTMVSSVPGLPVFDPVDVWFAGYSKFLTARKLAEAGLPVPLTRSATTFAEVTAAFEEWGATVVKPSFGLSGIDVERVTDPAADAPMVEGLLARYGTLVCSQYHPTEFGEFRITVAGEAAPLNMLKLPPAGSWRCKTLEGASFERYDPPADLLDLAFRAARVMGMTLAGLDILPTDDGYVVLEVNPVPGFLDIFGEAQRREVLMGVYEWVEKNR
jgi:ribosomal protein S6--L-glutamate ligase